MSIADKLQELIDSKADMKSAIAEKGVEVEGGLTSYASAIRRIQQGSGEGSDIDWSGVRFGGSTKIPLTPSELYKCGNMDRMFENCDTWDLDYNGFDLSLVDTSFATSFNHIFENSNLNNHDTISNWDTSNVVSMVSSFKNADYVNMDAISNWDTSNVETMARCFETDTPIHWFTTIPNWDYSRVRDVYRFLNGQLFLESIPRMNLGSLENGWILDSVYWEYISPEEGGSATGLQHEFIKLTDIGGFIDLKGSYPISFISQCPNLTIESLTNIIRDLYDWEINPDNLNKEPYEVWGEMMLDFGEVNLNKLTDDQIAVAIAKGWALI